MGRARSLRGRAIPVLISGPPSCKNQSFNPTNGLMMLIRELLEDLFGDASHPLRETMQTWLSTSRRFAGFVEENGSKIRKKLHVRTDPDSLSDLKLELETAYCLMSDRAFSMVYEPGVAGRKSGPDFAVTYTTSLRFMLEVTRTQAFDAGSLLSDAAPDRLAAVACGKLRQLVPGVVNVLLIGARLDGLELTQLPDSMIRLQRHAEQADRKFFSQYGYASRSDFFAHYQRLSEIVVRDIAASPNAMVVAWSNPQARQKMPSKIRTALHRSLSLVVTG